MLDKIKQRIEGTDNRQKVLRLLLHLEVHSMILRVLDASKCISGEIWIKDCRKIVGARTFPANATGLPALSALFQMKEVHYAIADAVIEPPGEQIDISIESLVEDEQKVLDWLLSQIASLDSGNGSVLANCAQAELVAQDESTQLPVSPITASTAVMDSDDTTNWAAPAKRITDTGNHAQLLLQLPQSFYDTSAELPDDDTALSDKRRGEYNALTEYLREKKEAFYETPEHSIEPAEGTVGDLQKSILKIMSSESSDPEAFSLQDPILADETSLKPQWQVDAPQAEIDENFEPPLPSEEPIPTTPPSPFADEASALFQQTARKDHLPIEHTQDDLTLLDRPSDLGPLPPGLKLSRRAVKPLDRRVIIVVCIAALAVPMFALAIVEQARTASATDAEDNLHSSRLVTQSLEDDSLTQQASQLPPAPSVNVEPPAYAANEGESPSESNMTAEQMGDAKTQMEIADRLMNEGNKHTATQVYALALKKYPHFIALRIAAIKAFIADGQYAIARSLCLGGIESSTNPSDTAVLQAILQQIPG